MLPQNIAKSMFARLNFFKKGFGGFTIIELVIVITIVAIVASVIAPIYAQRGRALSLERSSHLLAQSFRIAIEKALSSSELRKRLFPEADTAFTLKGHRRILQSFYLPTATPTKVILREIRSAIILPRKK